jgi:hypothetical protein
MYILLIGAWSHNNTLFVNASTCTYNYRASNPPVVIHLPFDRMMPAVVISDMQDEES